MLSRHLDRCSSCNEFATSVAQFTNELRAAPVATPRPGMSLVLARRRRLPRVTVRLPLVALTSAAAGVLMASVVLQEKSVKTALPGPQPPVLVQAAPENEVVALREFRDLALARLANRTSPRGQPGMYVE